MDGIIFLLQFPARSAAAAFLLSLAAQPAFAEGAASGTVQVGELALAESIASMDGVRTLLSPKPVARISISRAADLVGTPLALSSPSRSGARGALVPTMMPLENARLTSEFGSRFHPLLGKERMHRGIDLAAPVGTPVRATSDGRVVRASWNGGYGLFIALEHDGGVETNYGHLSRLNVSAGQTIRRGDVIGYVGSTGLSTGPHLHYEIRVGGRAVDPREG